MGRKTTLMGFSLFGFVLGFLAWLLRASVSNLVSSIGLNQDIANIGQRGETTRPNYVGGTQRLTPASGADKTIGYINKDAFQIQQLYTYGNLGRNTARNLGAQEFELGLYKNFPIRENKESVQFRAEFFNAFNHVNLGGIDGTLEDAQFGDIGGTNNDSREIQFALKLYF